MADWLKDVEGMTLKGQIAVPYTWWVGETGSRFLRGIRDEKKILGNTCAKCGRTYVPPRKNCGTCFVPMEDWVELSTEGVVESFTIVHYPFELQPFDPPFAYVLVRLEGGNVSLAHVVQDGLDSLKRGTRVRARFREERKGHILDIECFEVIGES